MWDDVSIALTLACLDLKYVEDHVPCNVEWRRFRRAHSGIARCALRAPTLARPRWPGVLDQGWLTEVDRIWYERLDPQAMSVATDTWSSFLRLLWRFRRLWLQKGQMHFKRSVPKHFSKSLRPDKSLSSGNEEELMQTLEEFQGLLVQPEFLELIKALECSRFWNCGQLVVRYR